MSFALYIGVAIGVYFFCMFPAMIMRILQNELEK